MHTGNVRRRVWTVVVAAGLGASTASVADCQSAKAVTAADIAGGQADALLKAMVAACQAREPAKFFSLQTADANRMVSAISPADRTQLFAQYCAFTTDSVRGLGGNTDTAVHAVGPYKNKTKCGAPASYWFVRNQGGELVLRLEVAVESGRLKIDTH